MNKILLFAAVSIFAFTSAWPQSYQLKGILGSEYFKHDEPVKVVAFSPDGKYMVSSSGKDIIFWDAATAQKVKHIQKASFGISAIAFSPDGKRIAFEDTC